jgi:hypothetical protein
VNNLANWLIIGFVVWVFFRGEAGTYLSFAGASSWDLSSVVTTLQSIFGGKSSSSGSGSSSGGGGGALSSFGGGGGGGGGSTSGIVEGVANDYLNYETGGLAGAAGFSV